MLNNYETITHTHTHTISVNTVYLIQYKYSKCSLGEHNKLLSTSVNIFPENFNTIVIPCLLQLKPKALLWMYNRSVQFIFQLAPNLLDGVEVRTLRGPFQQIPSVAGSSGNFIGKSFKKIMGILMANLPKKKKNAVF